MEERWKISVTGLATHDQEGCGSVPGGILYLRDVRDYDVLSERRTGEA